MASNSSAAAAAAFFGMRDGDQQDQMKPLISQQQQQQHHHQQQHQLAAVALSGAGSAAPAASSQGAPAAAPPAKKKRTLPDPDAEVIALSPKTLMATNRFVCEAHSKICGTREYRCDCGTLFSRRDSFITHRAFCDALAQESARLPPTSLSSLTSHLYGATNAGNMALSLSQQPQSAFFLNAAPGQDFGDEAGNGSHSYLQSKPFHGLMQLPDLQGNGAGGPASSGHGLFNLGFFSNNGNSSGSSHEHASQGMMSNDQFSGGAGGGGSEAGMYNDQAPMLPQMSATALLQKAAQMGATSSPNGAASMFRGFVGSSPHGRQGTPQQQMDQNDANLNELMNSLAAGGGVNAAAMFGGVNGGPAGMFDPRMCDMDQHEVKFSQGGGGVGGNGGGAGGGGGDMTRDFLGVGGGGIVRGISTPRGDHHQSSSDMSSLEAEMKSASSFNGGRMP
ncbi:unnamed protein product [Triticum turgidum subsp. durum]|uniref:BIRD-IDD transcription factor fourth C2HC zinc finger domain-containing protein n=1 Tax=Triticum turgidum subsp. durum TaxID=4567 RepID=A0A9R1P1I9_TRITD|nr:unnamed protein product [Triticum turgidum subsp. durum]